MTDASGTSEYGLVTTDCVFDGLLEASVTGGGTCLGRYMSGRVSYPQQDTFSSIPIRYFPGLSKIPIPIQDHNEIDGLKE